MLASDNASHTRLTRKRSPSPAASARRARSGAGGGGRARATATAPALAPHPHAAAAAAAAAAAWPSSLHPLSAMPPHLAFNAHILHGYRPAAAGAAGDGTPRCGRAARAVASSFTLHNETLNIWTHGVAAALAARALAAGAPDAATAGLLVCGFACFALSVTYHACMPATRGPRGYGTLLAADLAGVWAVNAGLSLVTTVQVGACWPTAAVAAAVAAPALAAAAALACATTPRARAAAFGLQAAVRSTTPMLAAAAGMSAWNADDVLAHLGLEAAVLIAAVLNVVRLPERMWPGSRVAAMASGHTIMHVVVAAVFFSFYARSAERARAPPTCGRGWAPN